MYNLILSHLTGVRGLKPYTTYVLRLEIKSHLTGVRGLKLVIQHGMRAHLLSHLTGVRGLKRSVNCRTLLSNEVAPYRGAWIETKRDA